MLSPDDLKKREEVGRLVVAMELRRDPAGFTDSRKAEFKQWAEWFPDYAYLFMTPDDLNG